MTTKIFARFSILISKLPFLRSNTIGVKDCSMFETISYYRKLFECKNKMIMFDIASLQSSSSYAFKLFDSECSDPSELLTTGSELPSVDY